MRNAHPSLSLPSFLEDWIDDSSNLCMYTHMQLARIPCVHLVVGGWYLDCSCGFIPDVEKPLYNSLVCSVPKIMELEEEPEEDENLAPSTNEKEVALVKDKGKSKRVASTQISTQSLTKASVQCTAAPATTVVGSPTATAFAPLPNPVPTPFHSGATIPSVPCKRKVVVPDTSATFSKRSSSLSLIENVDIGDHIEDLMKTKDPCSTYHRTQEFLTKVCVPFYWFIHSFHGIEHLFFLFSLHFYF